MIGRRQELFLLVLSGDPDSKKFELTLAAPRVLEQVISELFGLRCDFR